MSRRRFLQVGAVAAVSAATGTAAAARRAAGVRIRHYRIPWAVPRPVRVVHITDVHVGWSTPARVLDAAVRAAHDARPDLTVLTGDYVNHSMTHAPTLRDFVTRLPGPKIATLGNHDHWTDAPAMARLLEGAGATVLRNASIAGTPGGAPLTVVGVDDARSGHHDVGRAFHRVEAPEHALVLSHDPASATEIAETGGGLVLSGHTHGGQVKIPRLTDAMARATGHPFLGGWYDLEVGRLYVNAGLGHSRAGLRYGEGATAEVAVLELVPARA